jgi:hypothetical protein
MKRFWLCCLLFLTLAHAEPDAWRAKITFDVGLLDAEGLRGPADGKVAVDYEFCIPDTPEHREIVQKTDPSVRFMPGSRGRIGCGPGSLLCIGNTHQPKAADILAALAALPWIERIQECVWE